MELLQKNSSLFIKHKILELHDCKKLLLFVSYKRKFLKDLIKHKILRDIAQDFFNLIFSKTGIFIYILLKHSYNIIKDDKKILECKSKFFT